MNATNHTAAAPRVRPVTLTLHAPDELFVGPPPGRDATGNIAADDWDAVGASLGEPGVDRLLRLLLANRDADEIVIRIRADAPASPDLPAGVDESGALIGRLRTWMIARSMSNQHVVRTGRAIGLRALAVGTALLGVILGLAWVFQQDSPLGPAGPLRLLIAEALVIAGWVVMWRPVELLVFDPLRPTLERRLLRRALHLPARIERYSDPV